MMVDLKDKDNLDKGLWALSDWLKYNTESAWRNEHRLLSDHDYNYYREVIKEARNVIQEPPTGCDYGIGG